MITYRGVSIYKDDLSEQWIVTFKEELWSFSYAHEANAKFISLGGKLPTTERNK